MNKTMTNNTRPNRSFRTLVKEIRRKFTGEIPQNKSRDSDLRVVLYSHDTMGIGHMRRNLLIANQIRRSFPQANILVIAGAKEAATFSQNAGIDCLTLPAFFKRPDGTYTSRNLDIPVNDVLDFRSRTILAAVQSFKPDLFIVDKVPSGAGGELMPTLHWLSLDLRDVKINCKCVLGIRDILDTPENVERDWNGSHTRDIIRKHFDAVWIYGDRNVYDAVKMYQLPHDIAEQVTFTGYLGTESRLQNLSQLPYQVHIPYVLCTVGGGQDGFALSKNFVEAIRQTGQNSVLLTGPCMPEPDRLAIHESARSVPALKVVEFADEGDLLIKNASHVVAMGGYNTITAILSHEKHALIVPRVVPRQEQLLRANRLAELGLISVLHPDEMSPAGIVDWLLGAECSKRQLPVSLDMNGLEKISELTSSFFPTVAASSKQELHHA